MIQSSSLRDLSRGHANSLNHEWFLNCFFFLQSLKSDARRLKNEHDLKAITFSLQKKVQR